MKIIKKASGKKTIKMSQKEWVSFGKKAGWFSRDTRPDAIIRNINSIYGKIIDLVQTLPENNQNDEMFINEMIIALGEFSNNLDSYKRNQG